MDDDHSEKCQSCNKKSTFPLTLKFIATNLKSGLEICDMRLIFTRSSVYNSIFNHLTFSDNTQLMWLLAFAFAGTSKQVYFMRACVRRRGTVEMRESLFKFTHTIARSLNERRHKNIFSIFKSVLIPIRSRQNVDFLNRSRGVC